METNKDDSSTPLNVDEQQTKGNENKTEAISHEPENGNAEEASKKLPPKKKRIILAVSAAVVILLMIGAVLYINAKNHNKSVSASKTTSSASAPTTQGGYVATNADLDSLDPVTKGKAMTYGQCDGKGTTQLTHAPMDPKDIATIASEGGYGGAHVMPIDHEYYFGLDQNAKADTYPVYAIMDGNLNAVGSDVEPTKTAWNITLSHSCTFMAYYNLMTSLAPDIMAKLPANWKQTSGSVKIPVKAGDIIGYCGGQSLDFQLGNTETTLKGLLHHTAYNNSEPLKINGVRPLDYFAAAVKAEIMPKYLRTVEPLDGKYDYDVDGEAVGGWFVVGSNGYAGPPISAGTVSSNSTHLALAYDSFDPSALVVSIGNYQGKSKVFAVSSAGTDWTKITKDSGLVKVELSDGGLHKADGSPWNGGYTAGGLKFVATTFDGTLLLQLIDKDHMKVEIVTGKKPAEVTGFSTAAVMYDRGQDAHMLDRTPQTQ